MTVSLLAALDATFATTAIDLPQQQDVRYTYWPVNYYLGDPTVLNSAPLPLSGVRFSTIAKGVGEMRAALQVSDPDVRAMNPWHLILPRKTGIVVVRSTSFPGDAEETHTVVWHGTVWEAPVNDQTGRMEIVARTVEFGWSRRLITGPMAGGDLTWSQADRTVIVQDLLTPELFSQIGPPAVRGSATATVDAASADRVVVATVDIDDIPVGSYVRVTMLGGFPRLAVDGFTDIFRVIGTEFGGGISAILIAPNFGSLSEIGDVVEVFDLFPGWINVDKPAAMTGRVHDMTYKRDQQTNLLEAHQARSNVSDGYDWYTSVRVLSGANAHDASTYRVQYVMGYPRLGRIYGVDDIPRFSFFVDGRGNTLSASGVYNGSGVNNVVWGAGAGFDSAALRAVTTYAADWANGFLITEGRYSNPDVSVAETLQDYTNSALVQSYANERFLDKVTVRGDLPPYFGSYSIGDDALFTTDGWGNPDGPDGDRSTTFLTRIMGWTVTPPEGTNSERVELVLSGGNEGGNYG